MKKLMLLGGSRYLIPVIKTAHELEIYTITADYLPDNIAHKYSDEYINVSVIDKEAVLEEAKKREIDGIMSFACDPGVVTAAYVAEEMGLPTNPYKSTCILQNKNAFRTFLRDNGFNVPRYEKVYSVEEAIGKLNELKWPVIVKPTDSAGSKGVTRCDSMVEIEAAVRTALNYSISKECIIEEFIEPMGCASDADSLLVNGTLCLCSFNSQLFDRSAQNPYVPAGYIFPSDFTKEIIQELEREIKRLLSLLEMKIGLLNIETRVGKDGKAYIMECSPRAGGNRLSEILRKSSGVDVIAIAIKQALGDNIDKMVFDNCAKKYWGEIVLHSDKEGYFDELNLSDWFPNEIIEEIDLWVSNGEYISAFTGADKTIGTIILADNTIDRIKKIFSNLKDYVSIAVK